MAGVVGPLEFPVAAGSAGTRIADTAVDALLDFLAFWVKDGLDDRLANLTGTSADACPTANRFAFDPTEPRGHAVRLPVPSLYAWWDGRSQVEHTTLLYDTRIREIHAMYVGEELPALAEMDRRGGLLGVVDAAFALAAERGRHNDYAYAATPMGSMLKNVASFPGTFGFEYLGGEAGRFGIDAGAGKHANKATGRDYPALFGRFRVEELIAQPVATELQGDATLDIRGSSEGPDPFPVISRYLPAPDGSEDPET